MLANSKVFKNICLSMIISGLLLAICQLFFNRSLWLDEAMLTMNLISKSFTELLSPLDRNQVAPIAFLYIEKLMITLFGDSEFVLRLFPFFCYLLSVPLMYRLTFKITKSENITLLSTVFFTLNYMIFGYSSEVKQYSSDLLFTLLIVYYSLLLIENTNIKSLIWYSIIGIVAVWFSNISIIILFTCGLYTIYYIALKNRNNKIIIPIVFWFLSFAIYYLFFIKGHPSAEIMKEYWADCFMPLNPFTAEFYKFIYSTSRVFYFYNMAYGAIWFIPLIVSIFYVIMALIKKQYNVLYILCSALTVHLLISAFKLYPFNGRLVLYLLPFTIIMYSSGIFLLYEIIKEKFVKFPIIAVLVPALLMYFPYTQNFPKQKEETARSIKYIAENIKPDDKIYIYYASISSYDYYSRKYPVLIKTAIKVGESYRENWNKYIEEILTIPGDYWLLFSHVYPFNTDNNEENYIVNDLKRKNISIIDYQEFRGTAVYKISGN